MTLPPSPSPSEGRGNPLWPVLYRLARLTNKHPDSNVEIAVWAFAGTLAIGLLVTFAAALPFVH